MITFWKWPSHEGMPMARPEQKQHSSAVPRIGIGRRAEKKMSPPNGVRHFFILDLEDYSSASKRLTYSNAFALSPRLSSPPFTALMFLIDFTSRFLMDFFIILKFSR